MIEWNNAPFAAAISTSPTPSCQFGSANCKYRAIPDSASTVDQVAQWFPCLGRRGRPLFARIITRGYPIFAVIGSVLVLKICGEEVRVATWRLETSVITVRISVMLDLVIISLHYHAAAGDRIFRIAHEYLHVDEVSIWGCTSRLYPWSSSWSLRIFFCFSLCPLCISLCIPSRVQNLFVLPCSTSSAAGHVLQLFLSTYSASRDHVYE